MTQKNPDARLEDAAMAAADTDAAADAAGRPSTSFADLGLSETVLAAVSDMGYEAPTPVQAAAIPEVLAGRDLLAAAQTGTGKTAAFLLPTMDRLPHVVPPAKKGERGRRRRNAARGRGPSMLIVTPTRELAQQIDDVCRAVAARTGHVAVTVVGGVGYVPQKQALARGCDILVATPGRLVDLMEQGSANLDEVSVLVLDEADRMLDMGFLPQVRRIVAGCREQRQTLLFSATLDEGRVGVITDLVRDPARVEIAPVTSTADTVEQYVLPVSRDAKNAALTAVLKKEGPERAIVFVRTKRRADTCARRLSRAGITCGAIHGDRSQAQRERALRDFREGRVQVLVATDVLARGIDITDVRYVVNFDVPEEPTDYIHRIGRTGRAGHEGAAWSFCSEDEFEYLCDIQKLTGLTIPTEGPVPEYALRKAAPARKPAQKAAQRPARTQEPKPARNAGAKSAQRPARDADAGQQPAQRPARNTEQKATRNAAKTPQSAQNPAQPEAGATSRPSRPRRRRGTRPAPGTPIEPAGKTASRPADATRGQAPKQGSGNAAKAAGNKSAATAAPKNAPNPAPAPSAKPSRRRKRGGSGNAAGSAAAAAAIAAPAATAEAPQKKWWKRWL